MSAPLRLVRPVRHRRAIEEARRVDLIEATVAAISEIGYSATTLIEIAGRAGTSPGLVAHYFRDKDGLLEATLRFLARRLGRTAAARLSAARTPRERLDAIIDVTLSDDEASRHSATVWLAFWAQVPHSPRIRRVQAIYQARLRSNLAHALGLAMPRADAHRIAPAVAALIDGLWLNAALADGGTDLATARQQARDVVALYLARAGVVS
jgi:betaine-aldehyde dehydrogenase